MFSPRNDIEKAAANCDIEQLKIEIEKMKKETKKPGFRISKYVRRSIVTVLMKKNAELRTLPKETRYQKMVDTIDFLASEGLDFSGNKPDWLGITCLMRTATWNATLCRALIRHGAKLDDMDCSLRTALFYAVRYDRRESIRVMELLLDSGINHTLNLRDVLLHVKNVSALKLLIDRCIDHESEAETGKMVMSCISRFCGGNTFAVACSMMSKIPYSIQLQIKIFEYLGCQFMRDTQCAFFTLLCWKRAVQIGKEHGIAGEGLPFYDDDDEPAELLDPFKTEPDFWHLIYLYFRIVEAHHEENEKENATFILNGINLMRRDVGKDADFDEVLHVVQFLVNNKGHDFLYIRYPDSRGTRMSAIPMEQYMESLVKIFDKLFRMAKEMPGERGKAAVVNMVGKFVKLNLKDYQGNTALHWAVKIRSDPVVKMMLECGADVNAKRSDDIHNPFQLYIRKAFTYPVSLSREMLDCFVEHGAHVDQKMPDRVSFYDFELRQENMPKGIRIQEFIRRKGYLQLEEGKYVTLQCLAARVIADHGISYEGRIPKLLHEFIKIHK